MGREVSGEGSKWGGKLKRVYCQMIIFLEIMQFCKRFNTALVVFIGCV